MGFVSVFVYRFSLDAGFLPAEAVGSLLQRLSPPDGNWLPALLLLPILVIVVIVVHEAGHALAGRAAGFRLASVAVGPLELIRNGSRFTVRAAERDALLGSAAFDILPEKGLRLRLAFMYAAGPAANLLTAAAGVALVGTGVVAATGWFGWSLGGLAVISVGTALELLPFRVAGHESDGSRVLMLLRDRQRLRSWLSLIALHRELERGLRPRDLPTGWLRAARAAPRTARDFIQAELLAYMAAADRDDEAAAAAHLESCLSQIAAAPPELARVLPVEAAIFQAWYRRDAEKAAAWMKEAGNSTSWPVLLRVRFDIALSRASARFDDALRAWEEGLRALEKLPDTPQRATQLALWHEGRDELDRAAAEDGRD